MDGVKLEIDFPNTIPAELMKCVNVKDKKIQDALESASCYGSEFWLLEEVNDEQPEETPIQEVEFMQEVPLENQPIENIVSYPEVTNGQKAKLLLLSLVPGSVHADFNTAEKARAKAKELNISFPNWPVQ